MYFLKLYKVKLSIILLLILNKPTILLKESTIFSPENIIKEKFSDILECNGRTKEDIIVKNIKNISRNEILKKFIDNDIEIEHFDNYKPSLNDIFVSTVGDEQKEEQKEKEV